MKKNPKISIIVPVLNEIELLPKLIQSLTNLPSNILEVIFVDGGSTDGSLELLKNKTVVKLIESKKGRAKQMNMGAKSASGDILYFIHVDTVLPKDFESHIVSYYNQGFLAGCFRMKFTSDHLLLKISQWFTRFNFSICRGGDQTFYIQKKLFDQLNGFNEEYIIYEDNELTNRIYQNRYKFKVIPKYVYTSARRYEEKGYWKLQYHFARVHLLKIFGANPFELYNYYKKNIA